MYEWKRGGGGRSVGAEVVLDVGQWKAVEFWEQKAFQNFDYGGEKGDRAIAGAKVRGFPACRKEIMIEDFQMDEMSACL